MNKNVAEFLHGGKSGFIWFHVGTLLLAFLPLTALFLTSYCVGWVVREVYRFMCALTTFLEDNSGPNMNTNWVKKHSR